jgi:hypothetical protein
VSFLRLQMFRATGTSQSACCSWEEKYTVALKVGASKHKLLKTVLVISHVSFVSMLSLKMEAVRASETLVGLSSYK